MRSDATLLALLLLGCAGCSDSNDGARPDPAEEATTFLDPTPETTGTEEPVPDPGPQPVSVELPGLPIGGDAVEFSEASTRCAAINWSGDLPPEGVLLTITSFASLSHVTTSSGSCGGGLPPCLGGYQFTSQGGRCEVAVTWDGLPLDEGAPAPLQVATAAATCPDQVTCDQLYLTLEATGVQTVDIFWAPDEHPDVGSDEPTDGGTGDVSATSGPSPSP